MTKPFFRSLAAVSVVLPLLLGTAGCTRKEADEDGDLMVFRTSIRYDIKSLDPANAYDAYSSLPMYSVFEALYQYAYLSDTYKIVPLLAADLPKYSADRKTVTIPLRRGVRFQDDSCFKETNGKGRELKAQDFIFAWKRLAYPGVQSQGWWVFDGKIVGINAFREKLEKTPKGDLHKASEEPVEGMKALDDYTIQIKLTKPYPQLEYVLAMTFTSPVAREAVTAYADENGNLTEHPVGTGPFVLKKWERGHRVTLDRNPSYHPDFYPVEGSMDFRKRGLLADAGKPLPFADRIVIEVIQESQPAWLNFMKGRSDLITIPKDNFNQAIVNQVNLSPELAAKGMRLNIETGASFYYVAFNMKDKLVGGNKALRQAMSSAVDRDKWIEIFTNGTGRKQVTALPPGIPDRPTDSKLKYDYEPNRAKELLRKAGYPEGRGLPIINFDMRGADSVNRQLGEFFTQQFAAVGIKVNVIYNTFPAFLEKMKQGNLQVSYGGWTMDYPDPENVYQLLYGPNKAPGPNDSNFDMPEMNKLFEELSVLTPGAKRAALVAKADELLQEEVPWALGFYFANYELTQPWLLNYRPSEMIANRWKYLRVNKDVKKRYLELK